MYVGKKRFYGNPKGQFMKKMPRHHSRIVFQQKHGMVVSSFHKQISDQKHYNHIFYNSSIHYSTCG